MLLLLLQLIAGAGAVLLQREIPEAANTQVAKVNSMSWYTQHAYASQLAPPMAGHRSWRSWAINSQGVGTVVHGRMQPDVCSTGSHAKNLHFKCVPYWSRITASEVSVH
jgi:hypothetical protein